MDQSRIAVASVYAGLPAVRERFERNRIEYCQRHGYAHVAACENLEPARHPVWSKMKLLLRHLPEFDWMLWLDADALIVNRDITLESFVDSSADLIVTADHNGLNAGVFLLRNSPAAARFLELAWDRADCIDHPWREQEAMCRVLRDHPELIRVKFVERTSLNSYFGLDRPGPETLIVHFPSIPWDRRMVAMEQMLATVESGEFRAFAERKSDGRVRGSRHWMRFGCARG